MADAPKMIGLVQNLLGQWALATRDERGHAIHYTRADLIDMDVLALVDALKAFTAAMDMHLGRAHEMAICAADDKARAALATWEKKHG